MERMTWPGARWAPRLALAGLTLGLMLPAPGIVRAASTYKMQPILKIGDTVNGFTIASGFVFSVGPLNDRGELAIWLGDWTGVRPERLLQYAGGQFTTIGGPGVDAPGGMFPSDVRFGLPLGMNRFGNMVFAAHVRSSKPLGTFLWDNQAKKLSAVELPGTRAVDDLTFAAGISTGVYFPTAINNAGEIAFPAMVRDMAGQLSRGLFFLGRDNKLQTVALLDLSEWPTSFINDVGAVAFVEANFMDHGLGAYLWEQGSLDPLAVVGTTAPGAGSIQGVGGAWLNNANSSVLLQASLQSGINGPDGLYRLVGGDPLLPLAVPGQEMPGGGKFQDMLWDGVLGAGGGVSAADDAGQHVFIAVLADSTQGVYLLEADGTLRLLLKSGTKTELGTITRFGTGVRDGSLGVAVNNRGQIALAIVFDNGPDTIVLLTPTAP